MRSGSAPSAEVLVLVVKQGETGVGEQVGGGRHGAAQLFDRTYKSPHQTVFTVWMVTSRLSLLSIFSG